MSKIKRYCGFCPPNKGCNGKRPKNYATQKDYRVQKIVDLTNRRIKAVNFPYKGTETYI